MKALAALLFAALLLGGCKTMDKEAGPDPLPEGWVQCPAERPQVCTRIYRPVCAWLPETGEWKTYPSDCTACSDKQVAGYIPGKCQ